MLRVIDITSRFIGKVELLTWMKHPDNGNAVPFHIGYFEDYEIPSKFLNRTVSIIKPINSNMIAIYMNEVIS